MDGEGGEVSRSGLGEGICRTQLEAGRIEFQKALGRAFRINLEAYRKESGACLHGAVAVVGDCRNGGHEAIAPAEFELGAVLECKVDIVIVPGDFLEEGVAVLAGGFAELCPGLAVVDGDIPVAAVYLELRGDSGGAGGTGDGEFLTVAVQQPLSVQGPVVNSVRVLFYADGRGAGGAALADGGRLAVAEHDDPGIVRFAHRGDCDAVFLGVHDFPQAGNVGVYLVLQGGEAALDVGELALDLAVVELDAGCSNSENCQGQEQAGDEGLCFHNLKRVFTKLLRIWQNAKREGAVWGPPLQNRREGGSEAEGLRSNFPSGKG